MELTAEVLSHQINHDLLPSAERFRPERILDTAATLFWRQGYGATSTRQIAAALGIQQPLLYHYIASKEELLYRICLSSLEPFRSEVPGTLERVELHFDRIRLFIHSHLAALLRYQQRNMTQLAELRSLSRSHRRAVLALRDEYEHFTRAMLEDAQSGGVIRNDIPPKYLSLALMSMLNHAVLWFSKQKSLDEGQLAEIFAKVYLDGAATPGIRSRLISPDSTANQARRARKRPAVNDNRALDRALDAAVVLFSRKGYSATSTREVAKLLGIQKASLYYHVDSKEDLLFLVCKSSLQQIRNDVEMAIRGWEDPLSRTQALICCHIETLLGDAARHSTAFGEIRALSGARRESILQLRNAYEHLVRSVLKEAQDAGVLRKDIEVKYLGLILLGLMNRVMVWYRPSGSLSHKQIGKLLAVLFLGGALSSAGNPKP